MSWYKLSASQSEFVDGINVDIVDLQWDSGDNEIKGTLMIRSSTSGKVIASYAGSSCLDDYISSSSDYRSFDIRTHGPSEGELVVYVDGKKTAFDCHSN